MVEHTYEESIKRRDDISFFLLFAKAFINKENHNGGKLNKDNSKWFVKYSGEVFISLMKVDEIQREIELVLSRLGVKYDTIFFKTYGREELKISLKYYLISWSTLRELTLYTISCVLELGLAERDVNYDLLLRNKHFKNTKLPEIFEKHKKILNIRKTSNNRNKVIHEGMLDDNDLEALNTKYAELHSRRNLLFTPEINISDEDYKEAEQKLNTELVELCKAKKIEYEKHYNQTIAMLNDIAYELAFILSIKKNKKIQLTATD